MSEVKVNLLGDKFEKEINDSITKIEKLKSEKQKKENQINLRIKKAERNYERTDSEILKKQAKKDERLAKEELTKTAQEYDAKIAEEQAKIKALVQESKKRIEEERKKAEDKMKALHSNIKSWREDEKTKKRLKARQAIATSIAALKELLDAETDATERSNLEQQIEDLKSNISKGSYTKSENDTKLNELKKVSKEANEYYKKLSDSLDKLDELEELQSQLEDMGIETEDKDYSQENSVAWKKFENKYNKYVEKIAKPLLSNIERSEFKTKIDSEVKDLKSNIKKSNGKIDYTAKIEELSSEFDTYYKNLNMTKKQQLQETLENAAGKLSETPNLADELRNEFSGKITALNTENLLMLEDLESISSDMDRKIKELEDRKNSDYPQEIIDAFREFDDLCNSVKKYFESPAYNNERAVYENNFEAQRADWKEAIENKEEINVDEIKKKYKDLDNRFSVYKENTKKLLECEQAIKAKVKQAKTDEFRIKAESELNDLIGEVFNELEKSAKEFDGKPIDNSEILAKIEDYKVPDDLLEELSDEEKAKRKEAYDRAGKVNEEFQKNDKIAPEDKTYATKTMSILKKELYDNSVSTKKYIEACEFFIKELNRIKEEQTKSKGKNGSGIYEIASIRVNAKTGIYEFVFTNDDVLKIDTKELYERETDTKKEWTKEYAGRSEKQKEWKSWKDDKENQSDIPEPEKGLLIKGEKMLELRHMIGQLINQKGFLENSQSTRAGSSGKLNSEVAKKLDANAQRLIDPIIEEVLRLIDEINANKDDKLQYSNQIKYHDALKKPGKETMEIEYNETGVGIKDRHRVKYIRKLKKEAKKQGKLNRLFKGEKEQDIEEKPEPDADEQYEDIDEKWKEYYKLYDEFYMELQKNAYNKAKGNLKEYFGKYEIDKTIKSEEAYNKAKGKLKGNLEEYFGKYGINDTIQPEDAYKRLQKNIEIFWKNIEALQNATKKLDDIDIDSIDDDTLKGKARMFETKWMDKIQQLSEESYAVLIDNEANEIANNAKTKTNDQKSKENNKAIENLEEMYEKLESIFKEHGIEVPQEVRKQYRHISMIGATAKENVDKLTNNIVNALTSLSALDKFKAEYEKIANEKMSGFLQRSNHIIFTRGNAATYAEYLKKIKLVDGRNFSDEIDEITEGLKGYLEDENILDDEEIIDEEPSTELSEAARKVYNDVESLSKEEKKAKIEEEALKGHITAEEHQQLNDIFNLGPLPVAERKTNIFTRAFKKVSSIFTRKKKDEEPKPEDEEVKKEEEQARVLEEIDIEKENNIAVEKLSEEFEKIYQSLYLVADMTDFGLKFRTKIEKLKENIAGKLGKEYSYIQNCNDLLEEMNEFIGELNKKNIIEMAINSHLSGNRDALLLLDPEKQKEVVQFLDTNIKTGSYGKVDLKIMKSIIDDRIEKGEDEKYLYKKLNISEKDQEFLQNSQDSQDNIINIDID